MNFSALRLAGLALVLGVLPAAPAAEPAILAKARAFLGADATLNAVTSIHIVGTLSVVDSAEPAKEAKGSIDIIFQKPDQQRVQVAADDNVETTALDGFDGWRRLEDLKDAKNWKLDLLGPDALKGLRANTWENLDFYHGIESRGGRIEEQGSMSIDGVDCFKLVFRYTEKIYFYRYFEKTTGRLVFSQTGTGDMIREKGEMRVNGVRFPQSIVQITKIGEGRNRTTTMVFTKITTNEKFPDSMFRLPSVTGK
ncbi:MAG: hypothetical protein RLZZ15_2065 [Verrucomicrobiota bacterium]|jgi:outer membrane lipoprotein-sorting protein